jgi:hypothetical protein
LFYLCTFCPLPIFSLLALTFLLCLLSLIFLSHFHPLVPPSPLAEAAASAVEIGHPTVAFVVRCSFCQIYQENVFDLLVKSDAAAHASSGLRCVCARERSNDELMINDHSDQ